MKRICVRSGSHSFLTACLLLCLVLFGCSSRQAVRVKTITADNAEKYVSDTLQASVQEPLTDQIQDRESVDDTVSTYKTDQIAPDPLIDTSPDTEDVTEQDSIDSDGIVYSIPEPTKVPEPLESLYKDLPGTVQNVYNGELPDFPGYSYAVADADTGEILVSYEADKSIYPASTIKLLTAVTAYNNASLTDMYTARESTLENIDYDVWTAGIPAGTTYSLRTYLNLLLIQSYGDAACVLAEGVAGSVDQFVELMNRWAVLLGMTDTYVDNPIGLDIGNDYNEIHTTAYDIVTAARAFYGIPMLMDMAGTVEYYVPDPEWLVEKGSGTSIKNSCLFISEPSLYGSSYFTVLAAKTGYTNAAGRCLVSICSDEKGRRYICAAFGCPSSASCAEFEKKILEYIITAE